MKKSVIAATLGLAFFLPQAEAALFNLSYTLAGGGILEATLDGTLQADNNTVIVNSVLDFATFNGVAGPSLPFANSTDAQFGVPGGVPTLTLDGSFQDFIACTSGACNDGFAFSVGNFVAASFGVPVYNSGVSFGDTLDLYNPANYSLSAVPTPATLPLLAIGGAAMGWRRRKAA